MYLKWGKTKRNNQIGITDKTGILTSITLRHHRSLNLFASNFKLCTEIKKEREKERERERKKERKGTDKEKKLVSLPFHEQTNLKNIQPDSKQITLSLKKTLFTKHSQGKKIGKCYKDMT